ncbi:MAG TPA: VOC family protein [Vicinamibacterales bacterium]|nr:VOC family protein [Vicinamibacterales bacterium]
MNATPNGWPRLTPALFYDNAATAIDWLCRAFGFEVRLKVEGDNGRIEHSELVYGEGVIMVGQAGANPRRPGLTFPTSPKSVGGANTQTLMLYVDDVDAHCSRARAAGATIFMEPEIHDYGPDYWSDRSYGAVDSEGHHWWFTQRLRDPQR